MDKVLVGWGWNFWNINKALLFKNEFCSWLSYHWLSGVWELCCHDLPWMSLMSHKLDMKVCFSRSICCKDFFGLWDLPTDGCCRPTNLISRIFAVRFRWAFLRRPTVIWSSQVFKSLQTCERTCERNLACGGVWHLFLKFRHLAPTGGQNQIFTATLALHHAHYNCIWSSREYSGCTWTSPLALGTTSKPLRAPNRFGSP